jgi:hypothetical protein
MGNPKKRSRFICLKCLNEGIEGIQRTKQREKFHCKELYCIYCNETTKHIEIRHCDWIEEIKDKAEKLHIEYYGKVGC